MGLFFMYSLKKNVCLFIFCEGGGCTGARIQKSIRSELVRTCLSQTAIFLDFRPAPLYINKHVIKYVKVYVYSE